MVEVRLHDAVAVPLGVRLVAVEGQVTARPVAGLTTLLRFTVPAKLKVLARDTGMDVPVVPELKLTSVPTEMVKSPTCATPLIV